MAKVFNTTAVCVPEEHYMVNIQERLKKIKKLVDDGKYFTINRARQYGKTTTLRALYHYLQSEYYVVLMDFQTFGNAEFSTENKFSLSFAKTFLRLFKKNQSEFFGELKKTVAELAKSVDDKSTDFTLMSLFEQLGDLCAASPKPVVLMIDEVDSASNNQVFLDFLAQIRAQYINRFQQTAFQSVILAGVYDIKNLKQKLHPTEGSKYNSPWNIAADFKIDMSFSQEDIEGMLWEYEADYHTGMDVKRMSGRIFDYTSGYPFLVSRLCQLMDEDVSAWEENGSKKSAWTDQGFQAAVRMLLSEKNTLFESMIGKLHSYPKLNSMLRTLLFTGRTFSYSNDESIVDIATMFGFVKNRNGTVAIANRIFETRLYNYYLSESELQETDIYKASLQDKNQFIVNGHLNM